MSLEKLLNKLDSKLGKKKGEGSKNFKNIDELKKKYFLKIKNGKTNVVFVTPEGAEDPFSFWGVHAGLQKTSYWTVQCDEENEGTECTVCNVINELKNEDYKGNYKLYNPIKKDIEYYAPVVVVDSDKTIEEGIKWLKISKTVMSQLTEWIRNMEADEEPFYSDEEPQKISIIYAKDAAPADKYKLDKRNFKAFSDEQLSEWRAELKEIKEFMFIKSQESINKLVEEYFARVADEVSTDEEEQEEDADSDEDDEKIRKVKSNVASLKR